jgi:uncharacterized membrane protein YGL010W
MVEFVMFLGLRKDLKKKVNSAIRDLEKSKREEKKLNK